MMPSEFHVPPGRVPSPASVVRAWGEPPLRSIFFNRPCAKKPMYRLSGDQNGRLAPCVPGSERAFAEPRSRIQSEEVPDESTTVKASTRPLGEIAPAFAAGDVVLEENFEFSGGSISKTSDSAFAGNRRTYVTVAATAIT